MPLPFFTSFFKRINVVKERPLEVWIPVLSSSDDFQPGSVLGHLDGENKKRQSPNKFMILLYLVQNDSLFSPILI
jgi:hypothetical protein